MEDKISLINNEINLIKDKKNKIIFYTMDTLGNPVASIANIHETAKMLIELGYDACILEEPGENKLRRDLDNPDDLTMGLFDWLGEEYSSIPRYNLSDGNLMIKPSDIIVIPESLTNAMASEEMKSLPCKKVVFLQSYRFVTDLLGYDYTGVVKWTNFGFNDVLTTSKTMGDYVKTLFPNINVMVITPNFADYFTKPSTPKLPIINIVTRDPMMSRRINKEFLLKNPLYRFISFRELRGLSREEFAKSLQESFLTIWVDEISGFGTAPIEAMKCGSIVIGKLPNLLPEWIQKKDGENIELNNNGIWCSSDLDIADLTSTITKLFLEDSLPEDIYKSMEETANYFNKKLSLDELKFAIEKLNNDRISEFEMVLNTIK